MASRPALKRRAARGYSLIEMAIVLAVVGATIGALWIAMAQALEYTRRESAKEAIATVVANIRSYYGGQAGISNTPYQTLVPQLLTNNVIPSNLSRGASAGCSNTNGLCADTPWGPGSGNASDPNGTFRICGWVLGGTPSQPCATAPAGPSPFFGVALSGLTKRSCITLAETVGGPGGPPGLVDININGFNFLANARPTAPVTDADATNNCITAADGKANVTFIYRTVAPTL